MTTGEVSQQRADELSSELTASEIDAVAFTWVDNAGITRAKAVPTVRLPHAVAWGVGMSPVFDVFCVDDTITSSAYLGGPVDDLRLYPDLEQLVQLTAQPGWALAPVDRRTQDGDDHPACSRSFARRMTQQAAEAGLEFRMSFETEWCVSPEGSDEYRPYGSSPAYGMTRIIELSDYLRAVLEALTQQGVPVEQVHPEYAPGQLELTVAAADPVTAADRAVLVRQTIRAVSTRHGLRPSFAPVVLPDHAGNGWHLHVSGWRHQGATAAEPVDSRRTPDADGSADRNEQAPVPESNLFANGAGPYGITAAGEELMAGWLRSLPALSAIGAPSVASHLRLLPQRWAAPYQCWGFENREAALRLVTGTAGQEAEAANVEFKCVDGSANPYLLVGAVLAIAAATVGSGATLPPEVNVDPASLAPSEQPPRLPRQVAEGIQALRAEPVLTHALGAPLLEAFVAVHETEARLFADATDAEIAAATRWRW